MAHYTRTKRGRRCAECDTAFGSSHKLDCVTGAQAVVTNDAEYVMVCGCMTVFRSRYAHLRHIHICVHSHLPGR